MEEIKEAQPIEEKAPAKKASPKKAASKKMTVHAAGGLNVRAEKSTKSQSVRVLKDGSTVEVKGAKSGEWYAVDGGYVMAKFLA